MIIIMKHGKKLIALKYKEKFDFIEKYEKSQLHRNMKKKIILLKYWENVNCIKKYN